MSAGGPDLPSAVGGIPQLTVAGFVWSSGSEIACAPSGGELDARDTWSMDGGYSGDDVYDPAAGGSSALWLPAFGLDRVACAAATGGNWQNLTLQDRHVSLPAT